MCQPSNAICEIGICIGDIQEKRIVETKSFLINPDEEISPFITTLTGITNEMVKDCPDLTGAFRQMCDYIAPFNCHRQVIQWGGGDTYELKNQLYGKIDLSKEWPLGRTTMNVKNVVQAIRCAKNQPTQGGLKKMCNVFNVKVDGPMHRAHNDARATMQLYFKLLELLKEI